MAPKETKPSQGTKTRGGPHEKALKWQTETKRHREKSWLARFEAKKVSDLQTGEIIWIMPDMLTETFKAMGQRLPFDDNEIDIAGELMPHIVLPLSQNDTVRRAVAKVRTRRSNFNHAVEAKLNQAESNKLWKFFIPDYGLKLSNSHALFDPHLKLVTGSKEPYSNSWILSLLTTSYHLVMEANEPVLVEKGVRYNNESVTELAKILDRLSEDEEQQDILQKRTAIRWEGPEPKDEDYSEVSDEDEDEEETLKGEANPGKGSSEKRKRDSPLANEGSKRRA